MRAFKWPVAGLMVVCVSSSLARAGKERDGGDPVELRRQAIVEAIESGSLKSDVEDYFRSVEVESIGRKSVREMVSSMIERDVIQDIGESPYVIKDVCVDRFGVSRPATSTSGELGGEICFNAKLLAQKGTSADELVGLAAHEHAHHFGYQDRDHLLAHEVAKHGRSANPRKAEKSEFVTGTYVESVYHSCLWDMRYDPSADTVSVAIRANPRAPANVICKGIGTRWKLDCKRTSNGDGTYGISCKLPPGDGNAVFYSFGPGKFKAEGVVWSMRMNFNDMMVLIK